MKAKKKRNKKAFLDKFNERETKGNVENTLIKTVVDTIASSTLGTGIGAIAGKNSPLVGIFLIATGHYIGDKSGVLRLMGASVLSHGIAKAKDYQNNSAYDSAKKRLTGAKEDLFTTLHIKWKKKQGKPIVKEKNVSKSTVGKSKLSSNSKNESVKIEQVDEQLKNVDFRDIYLDELEELNSKKKVESNRNPVKKKEVNGNEIDPFDDPKLDTSLF